MPKIIKYEDIILKLFERRLCGIATKKEDELFTKLSRWHITELKQEYRKEDEKYEM